MNTETETLVAVLRDRMVNMTPDDRLQLLTALLDGYCKQCGYVDDSVRGCQCWNDE